MNSLFSRTQRVQAFSIAVTTRSRSLWNGSSYRRTHSLPGLVQAVPLPQQQRQPSTTTAITTRLYSFNGSNDNNNQNKKGFLSKLKNKAKKYIPFLRSDKEKQAAIQKRQVKQELKSNIKEALRDAPFPIRAMGGMVGSLLGNAMSEFAQAAAEQGQAADEYYQQAVVAIQNDPSVRSMLGNNVQVGSITSQSSSTANINGVSRTQLKLGFVVAGTAGATAQAQLSVQSNDTPQLQLRFNTGDVLSVPMTSDARQQRFSSSSSSSSSNKWNKGDDDDSIIEAEIIEKKPSR